MHETWRDALETEGERESDALRKREDAFEMKERQDPGTTRPVGGPLAGKRRAAKVDFDDDAKDAESVYAEVLRSLNRGADQRSQRKQKIAAVKDPRTIAPSPAPSRARARVAAESTLMAESTSGDKVAGVVLDDALPLQEAQPEALRALGYVIEQVPAERLASAPTVSDARELARREKPAPSELRLTLDPMVGREAGDGLLILVRTVLVGEQGYRQGLVLDREKLGLWLTERALAPSRLSRLASVHFDTSGVPQGDADFVFEHRFAEPFDALTAQLSLASLAGPVRSGRSGYDLID